MIGALKGNIFDVLPAAYVQRVDSFLLCPSSYVLLELVDSERDYVRDLGSVVEVFLLL